MRRASPAVIGAALGVAVVACIHINPFNGDAGSGSGSGGSGSGSDGSGSGSVRYEVTGVDHGSDGIDVVGPFFTAHFSGQGAHFLDQLSMNGGSNLLGTLAGCNRESGMGAMLFPTQRAGIDPAVSGTAHLLLDGPAVVQVALDYRIPDGCGSGSAEVEGRATFTFLPDGQITRWDGFVVVGEPLSTARPQCSCATGGSGSPDFELESYLVFPGTSRNARNVDTTVGSDAALAMGIDDPGDQLCVTDDTGTDTSIVLAYYFADSSFDFIGRHHVIAPTAGLVAFVEDYASESVGSELDASDQTGSQAVPGNFRSSSSALRMKLVESRGLSCKVAATPYQRELNGDARVTLVGTENDSATPENEDAIYGGTSFDDLVYPINATGGLDITVRAEHPGDIVNGFAMWIRFDPSPVEGSVVVTRTGTGRVLLQHDDDHDYQLWVEGGLGSDEVLTIHSTAP